MSPRELYDFLKMLDESGGLENCKKLLVFQGHSQSEFSPVREVEVDKDNDLVITI